jgi:hypothetical protein
MIPVHVALVDDTKTLDAQELAIAAGALNSQVQNDVARVWGVAATVGAYQTPPPQTWTIHLQAKLDQPGALGYHSDDNNQPDAFVVLDDSWTVSVSHELIEMLVDPFGSRMTSARLPQNVPPQQVGLAAATDRVHYLLEPCDPCEASNYPVGGVPVSDFLLPAWYRSAPVACEHYSHTGYCVQPRQVANGGYVSFTADGSTWYQCFNEGGTLQVQDLGKFDKASYGGLREWVDEKAREHRGHA